MSRFDGAMLALFTLVLGVAVYVAMTATTLAAQSRPKKANPCTAIVFKRTADSLYAELQAPRQTFVCERVVLQ